MSIVTKTEKIQYIVIEMGFVRALLRATHFSSAVRCYEPHMVQLLESLPASVAGSWKPSVCCYEPRLVDLFLTKKTSDLQKCLKTKLHYVLGKAITIDMEVLVQNTTYAENFF